MKLRRIRAVSTLLLLVAAACATLEAQTAPTAYTVTVTNSMMGPSTTMVVYRNGSKAVIDNFNGAQAGSPSSPHTRSFYDLDKHTTVSWNVPDNSGGCGTGNFSGDWGDPYSTSAEVTGQGAKATGKETIQGFAATVYEADMGASGKVKGWIDGKTGLLLKATLAAPNGEPKTVIEVKSVSLAPPPAAIFAMPASCAAAAAAPPPPTEAEKMAALTGGNARDYVKAINGPSSQSSCSVVFRIVKAGTLDPVTTAFQVALDMSANSHHMPAYTFGVSNNGHSTFSGGELHEVTAQIHNGTLSIDDPPAEFQFELALYDGSEAGGLIYRQCFGPQTTLLLVLNNPANTGDGAEFLWAKSGRYATPLK